MKYYLACVKEGCSKRGALVGTPGYKMKYDSEKDKMVPYMDVSFYCSECGEKLQFLEFNPDPIPEFGVNNFKSLPDEKKKEILRKRFDKDMKNGGADEKETRKRKALGNYLGYDGN